MIEQPVPGAAVGRRRRGDDRRLDLGPARRSSPASVGAPESANDFSGASASPATPRRDRAGELGRHRRAGGEPLLERRARGRRRPLRRRMGQLRRRGARLGLGRGARAFKLGEPIVDARELVEPRGSGGEIALQLGQTGGQFAGVAGRARMGVVAAAVVTAWAAASALAASARAARAWSSAVLTSPAAASTVLTRRSSASTAPLVHVAGLPAPRCVFRAPSPRRSR